MVMGDGECRAMPVKPREQGKVHPDRGGRLRQPAFRTQVPVDLRRSLENRRVCSIHPSNIPTCASNQV